MKVISVYSPTFSPYDSYGIMAEVLASGLEARGFYVNRFSEDLEQKQPIIPVFGGFVLGYPTRLPNLGPLAQQGPIVALTMFESTTLPPEWATVLNKFHAVIVPSHWLIPVFENAGVTIPIHRVPLGIHPAYTYAPRKEQVPFTFLTIGDRGARKGWHLAGGAFVNAFGDDPNYKFIIKTRANHLPMTLSNPNVEIFQDDLTVEQMADLYKSCDCMVFATKGEGFGLPPREFAATGGLVITTNWGGTADEIEQWAIPLDSSLQPAWNGFKKFENLGEWAEPDMDQLAILMKQAATMSIEERNASGLSASEAVHNLYDRDLFVDRCLGIWESVAEATT